MVTPIERHLVTWTKCLHIFFNVFLWAIAVGILVIMILASVRPFLSLDIIIQYEYINYVILVVAAAVSVVFTTLGAISTIKFSSHGLVTHIVCQVVLLLASIGYIIWNILTSNYTTSGRLYKELNNQVRNYDTYKSLVDTIQRQLSCCGIDGFKDWQDMNKTLPGSCCDQLSCNINTRSLHSNGCFESLKVLMNHYAILALFGFGFLIIVKIITIILSCMLYRVIKDAKKERTKKDELKIPRIPSISAEEGAPNPEEKVEPAEQVVTEEPQSSNATDPPETEAETKCISTPRVNLTINASVNYHEK